MRAVCLACGAGKWGALTTCRSCGHRPNGLQDEARHLHVCEDLDDTARAAVALAIEDGQPLELDEARVAVLAEEIEQAGDVPVSFVLLVTAVPVLGAFLLLFVLLVLST